jgi:hypothetical protein
MIGKRGVFSLFVFVVSLFGCSSALAHEPEEEKLWSADFRTIKEHLEPSYLTFGGGYDLENKIKLNDIYYEGELFAYLKFWEELDFTNHAFRLYLPIRVQLRQFRSSSSPVKTPSFNPGIKLYYSITLVKTMDFSPRLSVATQFLSLENSQNSLIIVIPAKAGIQWFTGMDPRIREDDAL